MGQKIYRTRKIKSGFWQITDVLDDRAYLVVGKRAAVLVDACAGYGDLRSLLRELTDLPVTVLLTHSHYDHVGGAYFFDKVCISREDDGFWEHENRFADEIYPKLIANGTYNTGVPYGPRDGKRPLVRHVREGDSFDLGGLTVDVVALPGHTVGSLGYLVREQRVLLSGDAVTPVMCLFSKHSLGIPQYRETLAKMTRLPFDRFYTGHHEVAFLQKDLQSFDACAAHALTDRGITWQHALVSEFRGTLHFAPCDTMDVDSPRFRALIGPFVPYRRDKRTCSASVKREYMS